MAEHRHGVLPPRLGDPHRVEALPVGETRQLDLLLRGEPGPVGEEDPYAHERILCRRPRVGSRPMATTTSPVPALDLVPSDEERMLRESVAGIVSQYGPAYTREKVEAGEAPTGVWGALGGKGCLGGDPPPG